MFVCKSTSKRVSSVPKGRFAPSSISIIASVLITLLNPIKSAAEIRAVKKNKIEGKAPAAIAIKTPLLLMKMGMYITSLASVVSP